MKRFLIVLFPLLFCLNSCEEVVEGESLPYEEKLVVRGVWKPNPFHAERSIKITKTLPVLEEYSPEKAEVTDAKVFVEVDGIKHELYYESSPRIETAFYALYEDELIQPGKEYKLFINWHGKTAYSTMMIPPEPEVLNVKKDSTQIVYQDGYSETFYILRAAVKPRPNECYVMTYSLTDNSGNEIYSSRYFNNISRSEDVDPDGLVHLINSGDYPKTTDYKITANIHAFDSQYYEYFATRFNNYTESVLSEPTKVQWNVKGDGIGMFTGYSTTAVEIKK